MADDAETCQRETWMSKAKAISLVLATLTTTVASIVGAVVGLMNHGRIDEVKSGQDVQVQKADERGEKIDNIERNAAKTAAVVQDQIGPNLLASYKYLQRLAEDEPSTENLANAKAAKAAVDAHARKNPKP